MYVNVGGLLMVSNLDTFYLCVSTRVSIRKSWSLSLKLFFFNSSISILLRFFKEVWILNFKICLFILIGG